MPRPKYRYLYREPTGDAIHAEEKVRRETDAARTTQVDHCNACKWPCRRTAYVTDCPYCFQARWFENPGFQHLLCLEDDAEAEDGFG